MQRVVAAVVFREVLKPLAADVGPVGDAAIGAVADALWAPARAGAPGVAR